MENLFKKGFLLGIGVAASGKEKLENTLEKYVSAGQLTKNEARSLLEATSEKGKNEINSWNNEIKKKTTEQLKQLGFVTQEDFKEIQAQLVLLQEELELLKQSQNK
ncbi:phasin family protein [Pseudalkalibacillus caeni]|uniref:ATP synthase subunit B n=1 Tax=Exobacillus caeni TaxID=2574798 RepID=A0A5R9F2V5_9BACL|nr:hypothetical protein [Pseudalkalibacillus caeni]TLS37917.1 hypothetical protein FCL54_08860 [Pseudalkalibacillus caeni]